MHDESRSRRQRPALASASAAAQSCRSARTLAAHAMTVCRLQVEGIQRLATLLQQLAARDGRGGATTVRAGSIEQLGAFLQWLVAEAATLSPDARTEALWWVELFWPTRGAMSQTSLLLRVLVYCCMPRACSGCSRYVSQYNQC